MFSHDSIVLSGILFAGASGVPGLFANRRAVWGQWLATGLLVVGGLLRIGRYVGGIQGHDGEYRSLPDADPRRGFRAGCRSTFGVLPGAHSAGDGIGFDLRPGLLEASRASRERPQAAPLLWLADGRAGRAGAGAELGHVSVRLGGNGALGVLSRRHRGSNRDDVREAAGSTWRRVTRRRCALFAMFALLYGPTGSFDLVPLAAGASLPRLATTLFLLALAGFGLKAGIMPLHFWLPSAHAMAPSHVSALMSGVLIKTGIYGLVRIDVAAAATRRCGGAGCCSARRRSRPCSASPLRSASTI